MRSDMSKVITERPRWGSSLKSLKTGQRISRYDPTNEYEDQPKRLPASQGGQNLPLTKRFTDVLGPLRRYLRKNVGRPWDKVYSELKTQIDTRTVTGRHVLDHVNTEVQQTCYTGKDGNIYAIPSYRNGQPVYGFYVHPRTRLLRWKDGSYRRDLRKAREEKKEITRIRVSENRSYIKIEGIWYLGDFIQWKKLTSHGELAMPPAGSYQENKRWMAPVRKKQCSKAELKAARLSNDDLT